MRSWFLLLSLAIAVAGAGCQTVGGLKATAPLGGEVTPSMLEAAMLDLPGLHDIRRIDGGISPSFPEYLVLTRKASFWLLPGHEGRLVYLTYDEDGVMSELDYRMFLQEAERVHRHLRERLPQVGAWENVRVEEVEFKPQQLRENEAAARRAQTE